jgi:hypothetical protein
MAGGWTTVPAREVCVGDLVRYRDREFVVARIEDPFMGLDSTLCLIEDTPQRWHAYPAGHDVGIEVRREA